MKTYSSLDLGPWGNSKEAEHRIARLAEENERLREALTWIAELAEQDDNGTLYLKHASAALGREE